MVVCNVVCFLCFFVTSHGTAMKFSACSNSGICTLETADLIMNVHCPNLDTFQGISEFLYYLHELF